MRRAARARPAVTSPSARPTWALFRIKAAAHQFGDGRARYAGRCRDRPKRSAAPRSRVWRATSESATTATASGIRTTRRTPFMPAITLSSTDFSVALINRALHDGGVKHARQPHVDRIDRLTGDFVEHVETPARRARELPFAGVFQLDVGGWRDFCRIFGDGAECYRAAAGSVRDRAFARDALRGRDVPSRRGSSNQHLPRDGAGLPQIKLRGYDRAAGAGRHVAPDPVAAQIFLRRRRTRCGPLPSHIRVPRRPSWRDRSATPCPISERATRMTIELSG